MSEFDSLTNMLADVLAELSAIRGELYGLHLEMRGVEQTLDGVARCAITLVSGANNG